MKLRWTKDSDFEEADHDLEVWMYDAWHRIGYLQLYGAWWEVTAYWVKEYDHAPDGARFESLHAAKLYMHKHAVVAIVGGYKP